MTGNETQVQGLSQGLWEARIVKAGAPAALHHSIPAFATGTEASAREDKCTILVLHSDFDSVLAAFVVANGAIAQGMDVALFFSFWGVNVLRGDQPRVGSAPPRTNVVQKLMKLMMPRGAQRQKLGKMHWAGVGKWLFTWLMKKKNVMSISQMMDSLVEAEARFVVCSMSMDLMGIEERDLLDLPNITLGGVSSFVAEARTASFSMVF
ncbi:MAG: DsrE/DsrF/DrsH-like family protein [Deltaproteobacteria bacterium]|nr:DsrE/DsrF/DrsH-like family protein [Deltaproteobacteria bacterium]